MAEAKKSKAGPTADEVFPRDPFARTVRLQQALPERFKRAREASWATQEGLVDQARPLSGLYDVRNNLILMQRGVDIKTPRHELGHAAYSDISDDERQWWEAIHQHQLDRQQDRDWQRWQPKRAFDPRSFLDAIRMYNRDSSHSFAETVGEYLSRPSQLRLEHPEIYDAMRLIMGMDPEQVK